MKTSEAFQPYDQLITEKLAPAATKYGWEMPQRPDGDKELGRPEMNRVAERMNLIQIGLSAAERETDLEKQQRYFEMAWCELALLYMELAIEFGRVNLGTVTQELVAAIR